MTARRLGHFRSNHLLSAAVLVVVACSPASAQSPDAGRLAGRFLAAAASDRSGIAADLRGRGGAGALALLDACLERASALFPVPAAALDLLLELCPASQSAKLMQLAPALAGPGRGRLLRWLARRDLPGFRDHEQVRSLAIVSFLDDRDLGVVAAELLAEFDSAKVAQALRHRLTDGIAAAEPRTRLMALARSFARLRAAAPHVEDVFAIAEKSAAWLVPELLPAFYRRPDLALSGRLDRWARVRHPAVRQRFDALIDRIDAELGNRVEHSRRLALYARLRRTDAERPEWALREAHVAVFDLARPQQARAPLDALALLPLDLDDALEATCIAAVGAYLDGADPEPGLVRARTRATAEWPAEPPLQVSDLLPNATWDDFELSRTWRVLVPPRVGDSEFKARRENFMRVGGSEGIAWRATGRRRLSLLLLGYTLLKLRGRPAATGWMDDAIETHERLQGAWQADFLGEAADVDRALSMRSGALEGLQRAFEGNDESLRGMTAALRKQRLAAAERGFRALVDGLAPRVPEQVIELPGSPRTPVDPGGRERPFLDITGAFARFYQRIGEEDKAVAILDHLAERLVGTGLHANRTRRANHLFDRASIAIDRRNPDVALERLREYMAHYEKLHQDVRQNPERYFDPDQTRRWYASRLAAGHISLAVLHNVVVGDPDTARQHCRTAYALDDSEFNRVLYACYLARDKRGEEAMQLLTTVDPSPALFYNMACTFALTGAPDKAMHFLSLDIERNHHTVKARNRQRQWAQKDGDLAALRGDPRFEELVRKR
ncbi:MAG: hypothetical protein CMJ85_02075 [Planctomycetes bacterium]|nr:hypothetical protein [Planctomycetota bacterium]